MAGLFVFEDELLREAKAAVARLCELGVGVALVSGDRRATVQRVAPDLGIGDVFAEVLPG